MLYGNLYRNIAKCFPERVCSIWLLTTKNHLAADQGNGKCSPGKDNACQKFRQNELGMLWFLPRHIGWCRVASGEDNNSLAGFRKKTGKYGGTFQSVSAQTRHAVISTLAHWWCRVASGEENNSPEKIGKSGGKFRSVSAKPLANWGKLSMLTEDRSIRKQVRPTSTKKEDPCTPTIIIPRAHCAHTLLHTVRHTNNDDPLNPMCSHTRCYTQCGKNIIPQMNGPKTKWTRCTWCHQPLHSHEDVRPHLPV